MTGRERSGLTRREAMGLAIGVAGIAAIGGGATTAETSPAPKTTMKLGCSTVNFRKYPLREALERIHRAGFEYTETQATGSWCPHVTLEKDDPQVFRRIVREHGFKGVTGMWAPEGAIITNPKSVEGITRAIRWAGEAGIPAVHAGDGWKPENMSDADALKLLGERLAAILEVAEKSRVYLAIEPHGTYSLTVEGLKAIMGLSPSKWLGINYDTANVHRVTYAKKAAGAYPSATYGEPRDEVTVLKAVADRVVHTHMKDVIGMDCVPVGQGGVNVAGCVRFLKRHGYSGVLSLETEGDFDAEQGQRFIELSRAYLRGVLDASLDVPA